MTQILAIPALLVCTVVLVKSTDILVGALKRLTHLSGVGVFGITVFLLAFTTSLPEFLVGIFAALEGNSIISLGNVLGSNMVNLSLAIGGAAVVGGKVAVQGNFLFRDLAMTFGAGVLPLLLLSNGTVSRIEGILLIVVYVAYVRTVMREQTRKQAEEARGPGVVRLLAFFRRPAVERQLGWLVVGVLLLLTSSHFIVQLSERIAGGFGIPVLVVSLFLVAVGTSLPELAFEWKAARKGQSEMALGDLLGSIVANSSLILGATAAIAPIKLDGGVQPYLLASGTFLTLFLLFWYFVMTKRRLDRWEGLVLIAIYLVVAVAALTR